MFEPDAPQALISLPGASKEIAEITPLAVDGADALTGDRATEAAVKTANLAQYRAIHFAVHASIDEQFPGPVGPSPGKELRTGAGRIAASS